MTTSLRTYKLKIPGKVVINGSYIVLEGETATVVVVDKYLNVEITVENSEKFNLNVDIKNNERYSFSSDDKSHWFYKLITTTLEYVEVDSVDLKIRGYFDDGFFFKNGEKSGLGSSSCLIICIVYSIYKNGVIKKPLLPLNLENKKQMSCNEEFFKLLYTVNKIISPKASGCDVMASCIGPINFNRNIIKQYKNKCSYILLGSFGLSTSTRNMLDLIKTVNWNELKKINRIITEQYQDKTIYERYLQELSALNNIIVPDRQFKILQETFKFNIFGCGISGAGGEDAVWCITEQPEDIKKYWDKEFEYIVICKLVDNGMVIY